MYTKKNTRVTFRSNRKPNFKRNNNFSINKPRNKGNVTQQYNKYLKLAKEASSSSDRVQSEYFYQFTDHYYRLMLELGITLEENDTQEDKSSDLQINDSNPILSENNNKEEKKEIIKEEEENPLSNEIENEDIESIESIPFISTPPKKKTVRVKKIPV
tara:strand:+ start:404 stop:877 length:474 start_codon:yes stop_codon:yes gene_type:complete